MQLLLVTPPPPPIPSKEEICIRAIFFSNNHIAIKTIIVSLSFTSFKRSHIVCTAEIDFTYLGVKSLGARKNKCECTHCFVRNSSFCPVHAFEVLTSTSFYRQFIICTFYLSKFHTEQDFVFKYHILQFYLQC